MRRLYFQFDQQFVPCTYEPAKFIQLDCKRCILQTSPNFFYNDKNSKEFVGSTISHKNCTLIHLSTQLLCGGRLVKSFFVLGNHEYTPRNKETGLGIYVNKGDSYSIIKQCTISRCMWMGHARKSIVF